MGKSRIYTKTGDKGTTSLVGGTRVLKTHVRLEAYGTVDELNSFVGFLMCTIGDARSRAVLSFIQDKLFTVGAVLATDSLPGEQKKIVISTNDIEQIEAEIDRLDSELPPLKLFVLPGGTEGAARAHICRTVCRRAERCIYRVGEDYFVDDQIFVFMNRLSDYFFLLARKEALRSGSEIFWNNSCE